MSETFYLSYGYGREIAWISVENDFCFMQVAFFCLLINS